MRLQMCPEAAFLLHRGRNQAFDRREWELFLRHAVKDEPFRWDLLEGAKGVQLAECGLESWRKRAWVEVGKLEG